VKENVIPFLESKGINVK